MIVLLVVVGAVVVGGAYYLGWYLDKKRREAIAAFAAARGWTYTDEDDRFAFELEGDPFGKGDNRSARNVIAGDFRSRPACAFDYKYNTYSTDGKGRRHKHTHRFHVMELRLPAGLPTLQVTREHLFHKIGQAFGFTDIELESEDFNRQFRVVGEDRKLAYDILHPRTMEVLLAGGDWVWRIERDRIVTWESGRLDLGTVDAALDLLTRIVEQVPSFVWEDRGQQRA